MYGALLYVKGSTVRFAVDHMMLWENRDSTEDTPGGVPYYRTRLPGLSLSISLQDEIVGEEEALIQETPFSVSSF